VHQVDQRVAVAALMAVLQGKPAQGLVRLGQARTAQERERRLALVFGLAQFVDVYLATGTDDDGVMGLVQGQHMQDVAEWVHLRTYRARQVELPTDDVLALAVVGRKAQVLNAGANLVFIVVGGFVADGESHAASR